VRRVAPWQGLALYEFVDPTLATTRSIARPWPFRVAGSFLPPRADRPSVGFVGEIGEHGMWPPFREDLTPPAHALIQAKAWPELSVALAGTSQATLETPAALPWARMRDGHASVWRALPFERAAGRITVRTPPRGGTLVVAEQYFPGWQVRDGNSWREARAGANGLIELRVPRGTRLVELRFDRWRTDRLLGWIATGSTLLLLAAGAPWREPI
jgi:hypothetical protein